MVEENLYSGRSEAEQASSLEQVLAQLARPAKEEFQDKDLHALHFHNHLEQKDFEEMVAQRGTIFEKEICFNACSVNVFQLIFQVNHWIITAICA